MLLRNLFTSIISSVVLISGTAFAQGLDLPRAAVESTFTTDDNQSIAYIKAEHKYFSRGAVVISQGYTEHYIKFATTINDLFKRGYNVYALDHRGQGLSGRAGQGVLALNPDGTPALQLPADGQTVHVDSFDDYVEDLDDFVEKIVLQKKQRKMVILGHSMGAAIANSYILKHEDVFDKAILLAPMYEPKLPPEAADLGITSIDQLLGVSQFVCGTTPFCATSPLPAFADLSVTPEAFANNGGTLNQNEWFSYQQFRAENQDIVTTRPSYGWLQATITEGRRLQQEAANVKIPVLMMRANLDFFVNETLIEPTCDAMPKCRMVDASRLVSEEQPEVPSLHELYREREDIRKKVLRRILFFMLR